MKNRKILVIICITILILGVIIFSIFFNKNTAKKSKIGNNSSSQEIVDYILNINSYEATIDVQVKSNKNETKYKIKQIYKGEEENSQEIIEPNNIAGVKIIKNGKTLTLENTNLSLTTVLENYEYISKNSLDLSDFIEKYKENPKSQYKETENEIIMETSIGEKTKEKRSLYIDRKTGNLKKMEIQDSNQVKAVYILYNEVNVNS